MATKKKRSARWTKLTPEIEDTILRHLRVGAYKVQAAEAAGVTYLTLENWLRRGEAGERHFAAFAVKVRKVQAENAIRAQSIITRAALGRIDGDWKAAAWDLERRYPKQYGLQAARMAAATVTINKAGDGDAEGNTTRVQFYLPDNGRRPQDDQADDNEGEA